MSVEPLVVDATRSEELDAAVVRQRAGLDHGDHLVDRLHRHPGRERMGGREREEDERSAPLGLRRGEHGSHDRAVVEPDDRRTVGSGRLQDGNRVVDLGLEVGELVEGHRIGESRASAVEVDQPAERAQPPKEPGEVGEVPHRLDVVDPRVDQEDVEVALAHHLVRDVDVTVLRVPRPRKVGHPLILCFAYPHPLGRRGRSGV